MMLIVWRLQAGLAAASLGLFGLGNVTGRKINASAEQAKERDGSHLMASSSRSFVFRLGGQPIIKAFSFEIKPSDDKIYIMIIIKISDV